MVRSFGVLQDGNLKLSITHEESGTVIRTDCPKDLGGDADSFSPTDLMTTSLPACILTTMGLVANRDNVSLAGSKYSVTKEMSQSPRRIGKISIEFELPKNISEELKPKLEKAAKTCPVHQSLHPDVIVDIKYSYSL
jgi:putative redox protein